MSDNPKLPADFIIKNDKLEFLAHFNDFQFDDICALSPVYLKTAINWCRTEKIYLIHKIIKKTQRDLSFVFVNENLQFYKDNHLRDIEDKTWLHVAVNCEIHDEDIEAQTANCESKVKFLVNKLEIDVSLPDVHGYTALHYACGNKFFSEQLYTLLNDNSKKILISTSRDDLTPLEIACGDINKLQIIKNAEKENLSILLSEIDNVTSVIPKVNEGFKLYENKSLTEIWITLLHNNNQYELMNFLKKNKKCKEKFYLSSHEFREIILNCSDNGNGLVSFVTQKKYFLDKNELFDQELYKDLTGFPIIELCTDKQCTQFYFNSALFLVVITGRFNLVAPLVRYCQFNVILYSLLTCLICHKLSSIKIFSDQFKNDLKQIKDFCEQYSIAVLSRTIIRDLTEEKETILRFLTMTEQVTGKRLLEIAYQGNCCKFLCLPACQKSLTKLWNDRRENWPALKFYCHSVFHVIFLGLFAYILIDKLYTDISTIEYICYAYGIGNFIEIFRQFSCCYFYSFLKEYIKDPANCIDIFSTLILLVAGVIRFIFSKENAKSNNNERLFPLKNDDNIVFSFQMALCCSFLLFSFKIIYFGFIFKQLGPKLKMIINMIIKDLLPLSFVFLVFILSFGITFESLMYPNSFSMKSFKKTPEQKMVGITMIDIFKRATYTIFDTNYCINELKNIDFDVKQDNVRQIAIYILLFVYIVVVNIMIMNLLIAVFSDTVTTLIEKSRVSWKAERYKNITFFMYRSFLPPPFNIICIIIEAIIHFVPKTRDQIDCQNNKYFLQFMSFKILQTFSLKDFRYKLVQTEDEKEHQREIEIEFLKTSLIEIEKSINDIKLILNDKHNNKK